MEKRMLKGKSLKIENSSHCTTPSDRNDNQPIPLKVGCLHINPASTRGSRLHMLQMLILAFVPHAALIMQNCTIMAELSTTLESSIYLHDEVSSGLYAGDSVIALQTERQLFTELLAPRPTIGNLWGNSNRSQFQHAFQLSDRHLSQLPHHLVSEDHMIELYRFRKDTLNIQNLEKLDSLKRISVYGEINSVLLLYITKHWKSTTTSSLCRQLSAAYELVKCMEEYSLALTSASILELSKTQLALETFQRHLVAGSEHLHSTLQYLEAEKMREEMILLEEVISFYEESALVGLNESNGDKYLVESRACLKKLKDAKLRVWNTVKESVRHEVWVSRRTLFIGVVILTMVLVASPILILLLSHTVNTIQTFNRSIELTTHRLEAEKQKSDLLLSRMLPLPVLQRLRAQRTVPAEAFDAVTIFFSDIVGFTNISAQSTPMEVINMLNMLYRLFDEKITQYNVYKVETIGDAYMVVSGLPNRNGNQHASEIADLALALMRSLDGACVPHRPDELLRIRAGVNTGPCVAGVVGTTMPRYSLFGDTINTASRMESNGEPMKIHISYTTKKALDEIGGYEVESRGLMDVAGKGVMETFWLIGKIDGLIEPESPRGLRLHDYDQNLLELITRS